MNFLRTILTEDAANQTWCPLRIAFGLSFLFMHGMSAYAVVAKGQPFDVVAYGTAIAALLTGAGASIFFNGRSEPKERA